MAHLDGPEDPVHQAALGIDPDSMLIREPRVLLDARFIASLHTELEAEFGREEAQVTMLQIGFLHGLRGGSRVVERLDDAATGALAPPLAIRFQSRPDAGSQGLEIRGCWPARHEAEAQLLRDRDDLGCVLSAGFTSGWLSALLNADILALETSCSAAGAEGCHFVAREEAAWRQLGHERAADLLDALPFDAFRELVASRASRGTGVDAVAASRIDPSTAAVHIWGPVMVIPFCGGNEAMRAMELITSDPNAREVSVVVVDLGGAVVDEGFGAAALERVLETAEALGTEAIFAGASPLCEPVIAELERQPLLVRKDLHEAISAAFQIARAQRTRV